MLCGFYLLLTLMSQLKAIRVMSEVESVALLLGP